MADKLKKRLDIILTELGLTETRSKAQALIMAGKVKVDGEIITKAGTQINPDEKIITLENSKQWASRGAFKLLGAFEKFDLDVKNKICADIGASTGGFTDVLLQKGAKKIYAIDVGYGQLLWRLANDPRVIVMDRTNARYIEPENFDDSIEFITCDASFISLRLILPVINKICALKNGEAVVLIKPQFEAGRGKISKGVIRDKNIHAEVLEGVLKFIHDEINFYVTGLTHSPIKGPEGNIEFLCRLSRENINDFTPDIEKIINEAHNEI